MNKPKKAEFNRRQAGHIPVIVGRYASGQLRRTHIATGDSVTLRIHSESVLVNDVEVLGNNTFRGRISGFEPSHVLNYEGHSVDDTVDFDELHVFGLDTL